MVLNSQRVPQTLAKLCFGLKIRNCHRQLPARFLETSPVLQPCSSDSSNPAALKMLRHLITSSSVPVHGFHSSCSDINASSLVHRGSVHMEFKGYLLPYQTTYLIRLLLLRSKILNVSLICLRSSTNRWLWAYSNVADLRRLLSPHHESASPVWWVDLWFGVGQATFKDCDVTRWNIILFGKQC